MAASRHLQTEHGDDAFSGAAPSGMGHAHRPLGVKGHTEAVGGEHGQGNTGLVGPQRVGLTQLTGRVGPDHPNPMNLSGGRPLPGDAQP
jgi:hypothetical protein